jgi:hypothetical protein
MHFNSQSDHALAESGFVHEHRVHPFVFFAASW